MRRPHPWLSLPADLACWMIPDIADRACVMAESAWTLLVAARNCEAAVCSERATTGASGSPLTRPIMSAFRSRYVATQSYKALPAKALHEAAVAGRSASNAPKAIKAARIRLRTDSKRQ